MSEQRKEERVRVLGVEVDPLRMDRAVSLTSRYLEKHKFEYIVFANTPAALAGQDEGSLSEYIKNAALVLPGDTNIENAVEVGDWLEEGESYQAEYFRRIFSRLYRHRGSIYAMVEKKDQLNKFENILKGKYSRIESESILWEPDLSVDQLVNSINSMAPSVLFICGSHERMSKFLAEHACKINAGLCFCMEEVATDAETDIQEWMLGNRMQKKIKEIQEWLSRFFHDMVFHKKMKEIQKVEDQNAVPGEKTAMEEEWKEPFEEDEEKES